MYIKARKTQIIQNVKHEILYILYVNNYDKLSKFSPNGMVFIAGDFNSRIGTQNNL